MKIYNVTHKEIPEKNSSIRQKIKVGGKIVDDEYINDSDGENISEKNPTFCELTALYWIWKNSDEKVVGLEHYRRKFVQNLTPFSYKYLSEKIINKILSKYDIIIPLISSEHSKSLYTSYGEGEITGNHVLKDFDILNEIYKQYYPDDYDNFYHFFYAQDRCTHFNMFICDKEIIDNYCQWLFSLFALLEPRLEGCQERSGNSKRVFGYLSERLFSYWIWKNKLKYRECYVLNIEQFENASFCLRIIKVCHYLELKFLIWLKSHVRYK